MGSSQGWFESDADYRDRLEQESNERIVEESTGSAPKQGWLESAEAYSSRISDEANVRTIEGNTGSAPSQGWFESNEDYRTRIEQEANVSTIARTSGNAPRQGWFEGNDSFNTRMRQEANEQFLADSGQSARKGWFEDDYAYRQRINQEANKVRAFKEQNGPKGHDPEKSGYIYPEDDKVGYEDRDLIDELPARVSKKGRKKHEAPEARNPIWGLIEALAEKQEIENNGGRSVDFLSDGRVQEKVSNNSGSGFSITTYTYNSLSDYERHQQRLKALGVISDDP